MADISKVKVGGTVYDVKDAAARAALEGIDDALDTILGRTPGLSGRDPIPLYGTGEGTDE